MIKKLIALIVLLGMIMTLAACTKNDKEEKQLHVGLMKGLLSVPYYYAQDEKIFEKYGLDVKLELYNKAVDRDSAFYGNKINAVSTDLVAALLYMNSGKVIVITSKTEEQFRLIKNKNYGANLTEIDGARIGVSENTVIEFLVDTIMSENGVTNYTKIPVPSVPDRYNQLAKAESELDMAIIPEPFPSLLVSDGAVELWNNLDYDFFATCFVVEKEFAESNYDVIKKFNMALNEAIQKMMAGDYEDYQDIIVKNGILDEKNLEIVKEQEFNLLTMPSEDTFNKVVTWTKSKGLIKNDYKLDDLLFPYSLDKLSN